jgi:hypothetical protein
MKVDAKNAINNVDCKLEYDILILRRPDCDSYNILSIQV